MPYRDSPHHEIQTLLSFTYLYLLKPNEHPIEYHIRTPNDKNFPFEIEEGEYIYVAEN